jgi:hypothetical protein
MTSTVSNFLVSRRFVAGLNMFVLILCALSLLGLIATSASQPIGARLFPALAPSLTVAFLLAGKSSKVLAGFAIVTNLVVLLIGVFFLYRVLGTQNSIGPIFPLLLCLIALVVFVPLLSSLSVAAHWPRR